MFKIALSYGLELKHSLEDLETDGTCVRYHVFVSSAVNPDILYLDSWTIDDTQCKRRIS